MKVEISDDPFGQVALECREALPFTQLITWNSIYQRQTLEGTNDC